MFIIEIMNALLDVHLMRQVSMIRFENKQKQEIAVVGTDVRLCRGFPQVRVLSLLHSYTLSLEEVKSLLSKGHPYSFLVSFNKAACLRIFIISGLLVSFHLFCLYLIELLF